MVVRKETQQTGVKVNQPAQRNVPHGMRALSGNPRHGYDHGVDVVIRTCAESRSRRNTGIAIRHHAVDRLLHRRADRHFRLSFERDGDQHHRSGNPFRHAHPCHERLLHVRVAQRYPGMVGRHRADSHAQYRWAERGSRASTGSFGERAHRRGLESGDAGVRQLLGAETGHAQL